MAQKCPRCSAESACCSSPTPLFGGRLRRVHRDRAVCRKDRLGRGDPERSGFLKADIAAARAVSVGTHFGAGPRVFPLELCPDLGGPPVTSSGLFLLGSHSESSCPVCFPVLPFSPAGDVSRASGKLLYWTCACDGTTQFIPPFSPPGTGLAVGGSVSIGRTDAHIDLSGNDHTDLGLELR